MADPNRFKNYQQLADAGQSMPYPLNGGPANQFLNQRMMERMPQGMQSYMAHSIAQRERSGEIPLEQSGGHGGGSDMDMMMIYGPEDQVAFDERGQPIPLNDPRHPKNQMQAQPFQQQVPVAPDVFPQMRRR